MTDPTTNHNTPPPRASAEDWARIDEWIESRERVESLEAAGADHVPDVRKLPTAMEISQEWLAAYREDEVRYDLMAFAHAILAKWGNHPAPTAAPAGGVTLAELAEAMEEACALRTLDAARYLFHHPRIGPLLRSEGAPAPKRVVLRDWPPKVSTPLYWNSFVRPHGQAWQEGHTAGWAAARAEVERQQGGQADG